MMLSPDEVKAIASKIIARSGAEGCTVSVWGGDFPEFPLRQERSHHQRRGQQRQRLYRIRASASGRAAPP